MIVAAPGSSSRLHGPAAELTGGLFPGLAVNHPRSLWHRAAGDTLVLCRGFDIPRLVSTGVVDIGITGYDTCVEWSLASGAGLVLRALPAARTSFVTYCTVTGRDVRTVYTEYPALTRAWLAARADAGQPRVVPLRGSTEGVIRADPHGAGVLLVTSGETMAANGLDHDVPLLATDVCLATRAGASPAPGLIDVESLPLLELPSFGRDAVPRQREGLRGVGGGA
ncbi:MULTISPECIES: hypothetical protein [Micromonospora]|uniref:ATP phosphoribosyltransferase catalytic domain-containing protein n=1 Tax=Micromonospora haikouensis TaxID=686309 RepID=A0A0D0XAM5_9ACTN|nr:hypothetical protein [Micromonospora haikouensis]KIR66470.1 hypothetical protein TK50_15515 [Micromonospora haikouensis]